MDGVDHCFRFVLRNVMATVDLMQRCARISNHFGDARQPPEIGLLAERATSKRRCLGELGAVSTPLATVSFSQVASIHPIFSAAGTGQERALALWPIRSMNRTAPNSRRQSIFCRRFPPLEERPPYAKASAVHAEIARSPTVGHKPIPRRRSQRSRLGDEAAPRATRYCSFSPSHAEPSSGAP